MTTNSDGPLLHHYISNPGLEDIAIHQIKKSVNISKARIHNGDWLMPIFHARDLEKGVIFVNKLSHIRTQVLKGETPSGSVALEFGGEIHQLDVLATLVSKCILVFEKDIRIDKEWTQHPKHQFKLTLDLYVVIEGKEHVLTGRSRFLAFRIESGWVEIRRMSLLRCGHSKAREGGAIRVSGDGHVLLKKLTVVECQAKCGAVYVKKDGHLKVMNCIFLSCTASINGGAIYNNGMCQLIKSTFSSCKALGRGGAVFNNDGGSCEAKACEFRNCKGEKEGGGFYNSSQALVLLSDNNYEGNRTSSLSGKAASFCQGL